jgi:hypothetical protein
MGSLKKLYLYLAAGIAAAILLSAAYRVNLWQHQAEAARLQRIHEIGKAWEHAGRLSEAGYARIRALQDSILLNGSIRDPDLAWMLSLLGTKFDDIVHARALGILSELKQVSPSQRRQISAVLPPLLNSHKALDKRYAQRVQAMLAKTAKG